jgi:hypothetical protein
MIDALRRAHEGLLDAESELCGNAPKVWDACHAALEAVQPVNHAFVHVLGALGDNVAEYIRWGNHVCPVFEGCTIVPNLSDPAAFGQAMADYFSQVPEIDERGILERLRAATIEAASRLGEMERQMDLAGSCLPGFEGGESSYVDRVRSRRTRKEPLRQELRAVEDRLQSRRRAVVEALCRLDRTLPVPTYPAEGPLCSPETREQRVGAVRGVCQAVREGKFERGMEDIVAADRDDTPESKRVAIHLFKYAWEGSAGGCLELLEEIDKMPVVPDELDSDAPYQLGVWEAVRSLFRGILPWPGGQDVHPWHPDYVEARALQRELAQRGCASSGTYSEINSQKHAPVGALTPVTDSSSPPPSSTEVESDRILSKTDDSPPQEPSDPQRCGGTAEQHIAEYIATHADATLEELMASLGLTPGKIRRTQAWKEHEQKSLEDFLQANPTATAAEAGKALGISDEKVVGMPPWKRHRARVIAATPPSSIKERPLTEATLKLRPDDRAVDPIEQVDNRDQIFRLIIEGLQPSERGKLNRLSPSSREGLIEHVLGCIGSAPLEEPACDHREIVLEVARSWLDEEEQTQRADRRPGGR